MNIPDLLGNTGRFVFTALGECPNFDQYFNFSICKKKKRMNSLKKTLKKNKIIIIIYNII